jgi:hypothetical protein
MVGNRASRVLVVIVATVMFAAGCTERVSAPIPAVEVPTDWPALQEGASGSVPLDDVEVPRKLPGGAERMLDENGFVVCGDVEATNLKDAYFATMPMNFITSDAVLYVFHCLFRGGFTIYEKRDLLPLCERLVNAGLVEARKQYESLQDEELLAEPARRNVVFFAVAEALLSGDPPADETEEVEKIVRKVYEATENEPYPREDFTVYQPRGIYAEDQELAMYFRAMKWISRVILPVVCGGMDKEPEASIKLRQAYLLGEMLRQSDLRDLWQKLYGEIGFFITEPDSFTPVRLHEVARDIRGWPSDEWVASVREEFAKPKYPASKIWPVRQLSVGDIPAKYVQFMGERYIPDGQIHQETCQVEPRPIPKGLDVAYALFDGARARHHLAAEITRYRDLGPLLTRLHGEFSTYADENAPGSIYAGWIGAIRETLEPPTSPHIPEFFASDAWRDKSLTTALGSWAQMRHDFILYAKQPVGPECAGMDFLVEPVPEAYERLASLAGKLKEREFPGMADLEELCRVLKLVSEAELRGENWFESEESRDHPVGQFQLSSFGHWLLSNFSPHVPYERPCVVADVFQSRTPQCPGILHEATGPFNLITAKGEYGNYRGWVLSYYEFVESDYARLTDREWEERVRRGKHRAARPEWVKSYMYGP